jgi:hypothetical protein
MITRSIGAQFAPRVVQGEAGRPGATLKPVAPKKALFNQLKQRMLVMYQNGTGERTFAIHSPRGKKEPFCPVVQTILASFS